MPRQPRLDAPGTLHHVMGRGIERTKIFRNENDREDFIKRIEQLCANGSWIVYAWALLSNHFHLLVRTGNQALSRNMRRLLTGYVINFNRRHKRGSRAKTTFVAAKITLINGLSNVKVQMPNVKYPIHSRSLIT